MRKIISEQMKEDIVNFYLSKPMTINACSKEFDLSNPTIIKILSERNIERYKKSLIFNPFLDEKYFNNIDSEHKAYWLGFLITDGNVHICNSGNRQASISIAQSENREYILNEFLKDVKSNTTIGHDGRGTSCAAIRSDVMANDLLKYGVKQNKSFETYLPDIDDKYMNHLIRGIIDGDGSITSTMTSKGKHKHAISICGTHRLMSDIGAYIEKAIEINCPKIYDYADRHLSEIKWQSIYDVDKLGKWIYEDASIYIIDKKQKYDNFISYYNR